MCSCCEYPLPGESCRFARSGIGRHGSGRLGDSSLLTYLLRSRKTLSALLYAVEAISRIGNLGELHPRNECNALL